jgi:predicted P-loop ATPase
MLRLTAKGGIAACLENARIALAYAPEWQSCLAYNTFANTLLMRNQPPWEVRAWVPHTVKDVDVTRAACWLQRQGIMVGVETAGHAMQELADRHQFSPPIIYLDALTWDGVPRINTWLQRHLGVADRPLYRAYGAKFLISAVARVRSPGCQVDTVLILEGRQGLKKSTTLRILAGEWFVDHMPSLDNKDAQLQLQGVWIVEFAELGEFGRKDANLAKRFISTSKDKLRKPYGQFPEDFPRQCVLAVTLNPDAGGRYLKDETGVRRFCRSRAA